MHRKLTTRHICRIIMAIIAIMAGHTTAADAEAIGTWRLYPSYTNMTKIEPAGDRIYVIASGSLYSYNTTDNSITTYDHISTLNSKDVTGMRWVSQTRRLVIAYADYSIDLLDENGGTLFITDIKDKELAGDKTIYSIYTEGRMAYVATGFGIVKIDTREGYIVDSYILNCKVNRCYTDTKYIYAMSETRGLLRAALTDNLLNPNIWTRVGDYEPAEEPTYVADTRHGCYWGPDPEGRLAAYTLNDDGTYTQTSAGVCPDGPISNDFWRLYLNNGRLYGTAGHYAAGLYPSNKGMIQYMENEMWHELPPPTEEMLGSTYRDVNCMAFDPIDKTHLWSGGINGLIEYRNDRVINCFNPTNSNMPPAYNVSTTDALVCSMIYDKSNTLWAMFGWTDDNIVNVSHNNNISIFPHDDTTFDNLLGMDIQGTFISPTNGLMWWINSFPHKQAIFKYDYTSDLLTTYQEIKDQDGNIINVDYLYDIIEDHRGNIWLATTSGPLYFTYDKNRTTDGNTLNVTKHKVPRNDGTNYADYLLDGINIRTIAIDAINRKWFGTNGNGVFLISSDNNTQIKHFTTENSPLISDVIFDILIDETTGIVYFATDKGLCSYQSDVNIGQGIDIEITEDNVWAYPNPVTPEHTGDITIVGLGENTDIKIVTSSGRIVNSGRCTGGSYRWNGCDMDGKSVASGIYMVLIANGDGSKILVTKIGIVR